MSAAILGAMIGASVFFAALAYLRAMPDAPAGAGYWTAGYGLWVLRLACYLAAGHIEPQFLSFLAEALQATASLLLLAGTLHFVGRPPKASLLFHAILAVTLWAGFAVYVIDDFLLRSIPLYMLSGAALIWAGIAILRVT